MSEPPTEKTPLVLPPAIAEDFAKWQAKKAAVDAEVAPKDFGSLKEEFLAVMANLPETVEIPYHLTPEGERKAKFDQSCPPEFNHRIDRARLTNPVAFDAVAQWDGEYPGVCATGKSGAGKSRAAWSALGRLWVREGVGFSWWPMRRLIKAIDEADGGLDGLMWRHQASRVFFLDDADKANWQFETTSESLFAFFDHIYRKNLPLIVTTNNGRKWWTDKMGEAFVRRMFDEACREVRF
jgi:hypothetical protein